MYGNGGQQLTASRVQRLSIAIRCYALTSLPKSTVAKRGPSRTCWQMAWASPAPADLARPVSRSAGAAYFFRPEKYLLATSFLRTADAPGFRPVNLSEWLMFRPMPDLTWACSRTFMG